MSREQPGELRVVTSYAPRAALTLVEAASLYGVSDSVIRRAIHATAPPFLRAKRVGRAYMVSVAALEAWWEQLPDA